jgi:polyribonucleotide nucleotidyltransferase
MLQPFEATRLTQRVGNLHITMETGRMANQADGAVWVQSGGTVVLVTAVTQPMEFDKGFFPLVCHYQEMSYAAGRIPGNYFRREIGRPSERETLISRLIDRPIRPLFPKGFKDEVQIIATVLSADRDVNPDVLALTGASTALHISKIPFLGPIAGARVGYIDGGFVLYPSYAGIDTESSMDIVFSASRDAVVMVEGRADFMPEETIAEGLDWAHRHLAPLFDMQEELRAKVGHPKMEFEAPQVDADLQAAVRDFAGAQLSEVMYIPEKMPRREALTNLKKGALESVAEKWDVEDPAVKRQVSDTLKELEKEIMRETIKSKGTRIDGRDTTTVRPLSIDVGILPQTHGSCLFARGETKALCIATLGSTRDEQRIDTLMGDETKEFMVHYNFPPYCVGEVKMLRGPARREIGHGMLAERALSPVLPGGEEDEDKFPFTTRIVSEIMESNGSSSMATVCGGSLALMDAGVPVKAAVAGIAMGLAKVDDDYFVLTDILGDEDAMGDMDFKVAGTREGVTAIQMDIKITGIPQDVLNKALSQARDGRLSILDDMDKILARPRPEMSELAPQYKTVHINPEKIRDVIGPGGKNVKAITAETEADIDINDDGTINIFAPTLEALNSAVEQVLYYDQTPELGANYKGRVVKVTDFGAFLEILPGVEGLLHVSQMDVEHVRNVTDILDQGDEAMVKVVEIEKPSGKVRLSRKAWLMEEAGEEINLEDFSRSAGGGGGRGGPRGGGGRGGRPGGGRPGGGGGRR